MAGKKKNAENKKEPTAPAEKKDPGIAALIAVVGFLVLSAPSIGYIYLGKVKKGLIYLLLVWASWLVVALLYFVGIFASGGIGMFVCLPIFILPLIFEIYMIWDIYLDAKGEKTKLPEFD